jgi:hypothetical protein
MDHHIEKLKRISHGNRKLFSKRSAREEDQIEIVSSHLEKSNKSKEIEERNRFLYSRLVDIHNRRPSPFLKRPEGHYRYKSVSNLKSPSPQLN